MLYSFTEKDQHWKVYILKYGCVFFFFFLFKCIFWFTSKPDSKFSKKKWINAVKYKIFLNVMPFVRYVYGASAMKLSQK